jgi:hypothetical protein
MEKDGIASYYLMLRWVATSDLKWATAAETVLDAWSASLVGFAGHDQMLAVGLYGGHMAQAAELLAYAKPQWPQRARAQAMFRDVVHPACMANVVMIGSQMCMPRSRPRLHICPTRVPITLLALPASSCVRSRCGLIGAQYKKNARLRCFGPRDL